MKKSTTIIRILFFLVCSLLSIHLSAQTTILSAEKWQEDVQFFKKTIHEDYPFLFKKVDVQTFDAAIEKLHNDIPTMQDHEVMAGLLRAVSLFQYGHTDMGFDGVIKLHKLPINFYEYNDGTYIEGGHQLYSKIIGAKVLAIEGMPIEEALVAIEPTVPAENTQFFKAYGINYLAYTELLHAQRITKELKHEITLTVSKDGKTFDHKVKAIAKEEVPKTQYGMVKSEGEWVSARDQSVTPRYIQHLDKNYYYDYIPEQKTMYVRQSKVFNDGNQTIPEFYEEVFDFVEKNEVEKFVLDVRLNGGGNNFLNKTLITGLIEQTKINQKGKLYVIIGRRTFSACQNMINELKRYTNATFVGEPSAENLNFYGDARRVNLPNSEYTMYLSYAWWQDFAPWRKDRWMAPDITIDMSFEEYRTNQDPVLDRVLSQSTTKVLVDPLDHLTALFTAGKYDELESEAKRMVKSPDYKDYDFIENFGNAGNRLINIGNADGGLFILNLLATSYPENADVQLTAANAFAKMEKAEKARNFYTKVIELAPKSKAAKIAKEKLSALKN